MIYCFIGFVKRLNLLMIIYGIIQGFYIIIIIIALEWSSKDYIGSYISFVYYYYCAPLVWLLE